MTSRIANFLLATSIAATPVGAMTFPKPPHGRIASVPGTCVFTRVFWVGQRLGDANSGSSITLANGVMGVGYDQLPAVNSSHVGDRVMTCLAKLPRNCPPGDQRGKWYTTTNLRTDEAWTLPDAEHQCGGA